MEYPYSISASNHTRNNFHIIYTKTSFIYMVGVCTKDFIRIKSYINVANSNYNTLFLCICN